MIIKHRAKTTNGKWVEGYVYPAFFNNGKGVAIIIDNDEIAKNYGGFTHTRVDPTTIEPILPVCEWKYSPNSARDFITTCGAIETPHHGKYIPYCFCPNCGGRILNEN